MMGVRILPLMTSFALRYFVIFLLLVAQASTPVFADKSLISKNFRAGWVKLRNGEVMEGLIASKVDGEIRFKVVDKKKAKAQVFSERVLADYGLYLKPADYAANSSDPDEHFAQGSIQTSKGELLQGLVALQKKSPGDTCANGVLYAANADNHVTAFRARAVSRVTQVGDIEERVFTFNRGRLDQVIAEATMGVAIKLGGDSASARADTAAIGAYDAKIIQEEYVLINIATNEERIVHKAVARDSVEDLLHDCDDFSTRSEREQPSSFQFGKLQESVAYMNRCPRESPNN
jgi:hypothetical protein